VGRRGVPAFVEEHVHDDWFLYCNPTPPHSPDNGAALEDFSVRDTPSGVLAVDPILDAPIDRAAILAASLEAEPVRAQIRDAYRGVAWIDAGWASLRATLERLDVFDDTVVLFMMDHGYVAKGTLFEAGARTALFVRHPATFEAGSRIDRLVANVDVAPTFYDIAGLPAADDVDGRSLLLADPGGDRLVFVENNKDRAVVSRDFKLIKRAYETDVDGCAARQEAIADAYYQANADAEQLYRNPASTGETVNVIGDDEYAADRERLRAALSCLIRATSPAEEADYERCYDIATPAPTAGLEVSCVDSATWYYKKSKNTCAEYVAKKSKYCKEKYASDDGVSARDACPITCASGCGCVDSTSWFYNKKTKRTCDYVAKKPSDRCKSKNADDAEVDAVSACPAACGENCQTPPDDSFRAWRS